MAIFALAMYDYHESPAQVLDRIVRYVNSIFRPKPAPEPQKIVPTPTATPTPTPEPGSILLTSTGLLGLLGLGRRGFRRS